MRFGFFCVVSGVKGWDVRLEVRKVVYLIPVVLSPMLLWKGEASAVVSGIVNSFVDLNR
jgi:predicted alpha/beta hydrolase